MSAIEVGVALPVAWPDRFRSKITATTSCWLWSAGTTSHGYGCYWVPERGTMVMAHRVAYQLEHGAIPDGLVLDHLCRVRNCVNPAHLRATTHQLNILAGVGATARNAAKTHCSRGHAFVEHGYFDERSQRRCCSICRPAPTRRRDGLTHCCRGHEFTSENTYVTVDGRRQCRECRRMHKQGRTR